MNDQLDLLTHARDTDPYTSHIAASMVNINARCKEVLEAARQFSFHVDSIFTDGDLADFMAGERSVIARRRKDLTDRGLVEAVLRDGQQESRMGRRGRPEVLWMLTPAGRNAVAA